jgi:plasmid maintenance system antidote protein VapI
MARKKLESGRGGCWFCGEDECDAFDSEWDTYLHLDCLRETLKREPDHEEAVHMRYLIEPFVPDWASPPGDTINDMILEKIGQSASSVDELAMLASRLGLSDANFRLLIDGDLPITGELAEKLEQALGGSARFWMTREEQYRALLAKRTAAVDLALSSHSTYAKGPSALHPRPDSIYYRELDGGYDITVYPMTFGRARICFSKQGDGGIIDVFEYEDPAIAIAAAMVWTGKGDPLVGWNRHANSGRRRPGGDPSKEERGRD